MNSIVKKYLGNYFLCLFDKSKKITPYCKINKSLFIKFSIGLILILIIFSYSISSSQAKTCFLGICHYTEEERYDYSCTEWGAANGMNCKGNIFDSWWPNVVERSKIEATTSDPFTVQYQVSMSVCNLASSFAHDGCLYTYPDGQSIIIDRSNIFDTDNHNELSYQEIDSYFFAGTIDTALFRVSKANASKISQKFIDFKKANYPNEVAIICTSMQARGEYYDTSWCVPEPQLPAPPIFNEIMVTGFGAHLVDLSSGTNFYPGSKFESPSIQITRFPGDMILTLQFQDLIQNPTQSYTAYQYFSNDLTNTPYYAVINPSDSSSICAYSGQYINPAQNAINLIGCASRPSIQQSSNYSIIAEYSVVCASPILNTSNSNYAIYNPQSYQCVDQQSGEQLPEYRPYQAVIPILLNTDVSNIGTDVDGSSVYIGANYALYKQQQVNGVMVSVPPTGSVSGRFTAGKINLNSGINPIILGLLIKSAQPSAITTDPAGIREQFLFQIPLTISQSGQITSTQWIYGYDSANLTILNQPININIASIIPSMSSNNPATPLNINVSNVTDGTNANCGSYVQASINAGTPYFIPAQANKRDREYCYCSAYTNGQGQACTDTTPKCNCILCQNVNANMNVAQAVCPGTYWGISSSQSLPDQICFYSTNNWDFISGMKGGKANSQSSTIQTNTAVCTYLPNTCNPVTVGASWNGYATWGNSAQFGQNNLAGTCISGYEKVKSYSNNDLVQPNQCSGYGSISNTVQQSLQSLYQQAQLQWQQLVSQANANSTNISPSQINNMPSLSQYISDLNQYLPNCNNGTQGTPNSPLADCIGGIYDNFRNACVPTSSS